MKILLIIFGLGILFITNSYSQSIYGVYHGSLVTDKNLIYIEENDGNTFIKIFFSEKESIQVSGKVSNEKLTFPLPLFEGEDLTVCAELSEDSSRLNIEFEVDGKSYSTTFERIESPKRNLVMTWFDDDSNNRTLDPRVVGKWVNYLTTDSLGNPIESVAVKKPYVTSFLDNGVYLIDLQLIRDVFEEAGNAALFDYTKLPKSSWYTLENNRLVVSVNGTDVKYQYEVSADSLKLVSTEIGSVLYHVRK
jgi:hypothetical protein